MTFEEWTSCRNQRYVHLILHGKDSKIWNLGLVRIKGSLSSVKCLALVEKRLELFSLCMKTDIVSIMTDGASVMTKIGRISSTYQQLCFAHGIQLAVIDVLYKKKSKVTAQTTMDQSSDNENESGIEEDNSELDEESSDVDEGNSDVDYEDDSNFGIDIAYDEIQIIDIQENFKPLVEKVRKIVRMFRRSPLKNEVLQSYVKIECPDELSLILDSKTRWNSLAIMLNRFYKLRNCIQ